VAGTPVDAEAAADPTVESESDDASATIDPDTDDVTGDDPGEA
jgi:hypothetical protein